MPSYQDSAGSSKAAKFAAANPLGPMADPFAGLVRTYTVRTETTITTNAPVSTA